MAVGFDAQDVERALRELQAAGLIDDERFARELARDRAGRRLEGDRLVRATLVRQGISPDLADRVLDQAASAPNARDQAERAAELAARKASRMRGVAPEVAYRRLLGLLLRRGHPPDAAREAARRAVRDLADPCDPSASAVD